MDPEEYQQGVSDWAAESSQWVEQLGWVTIIACAVAVAIYVFLFF